MNTFVSFLTESKLSINQDQISYVLEDEFDEFLGVLIDLQEEKDSPPNQPWKKSDFYDVPDDDKEIQKFIKKEIDPYLEKVRPAFEHGVKKALNKVLGAQAMFDKKLLPSIINKVNRNVSLNVMNDILRGQVLTDSPEDQKKITNILKRTFNFVKHDYKKFGTYDDTGYYGSHHLIIEIEGVMIELQIMPKTLWIQKEMAHVFYKKLQINLKKDPNYKKTQEYELEKSKSHQLFKWGNGGKYFRSYQYR